MATNGEKYASKKEANSSLQRASAEYQSLSGRHGTFVSGSLFGWVFFILLFSIAYGGIPAAWWRWVHYLAWAVVAGWGAFSFWLVVRASYYSRRLTRLQNEVEEATAYLDDRRMSSRAKRRR